jgi:hypothetical protein
MAQLISEAANYSATEFDTLIPDLNDPADIKAAFLSYHFGVYNFNGAINEPSPNSIHSHLKVISDLLSEIETNAVLTLSGVENETLVSASSGFVTVGLADDVTVPNDLQVSNNAYILGAMTTANNLILKGGMNVFIDDEERDEYIEAPAEGNLSYIKSEESFSVYNGSSWVPIEENGSLREKIQELEILTILGV